MKQFQHLWATIIISAAWSIVTCKGSSHDQKNTTVFFTIRKKKTLLYSLRQNSFNKTTKYKSFPHELPETKTFP